MSTSSSVGSPLTLEHVFGMKGDTNSNIHYIDEVTVVYPAGYNIIVYNLEKKTQRILQMGAPDIVSSCDISAMAVSPRVNGKSRYLAVAERGETSKASIAIYDLQTFRRKARCVTAPGTVSFREFVSLAFSADGKVLLSQGGGPDWALISWQWEKGKPLQTARVSTQSSSQIHQVSFCPVDPSVVCVTGNGVLRFLKAENTEFRTVAVSIGKREPQNYLSHCWLEERVVVGTDTGDLLLFENGDFLGVLESSPSDGKSIDSITPRGKGFVCGCDEGVMYVYERDDKEYYKLSKSFQIDGHYVRIRSIATSPGDDYAICSLENNQAFILGLTNSDLLKTEDLTFEPLHMPVHFQAILGLDVAIRKPLAVTCGVDRSVRLWNYVTKALVAQHFFEVQPHSCAIHPSALLVLVGFSDCLRVMSLLADDLRPFKEIPIKGCREVRFSHGGHLFAAADGSTIQIYSTYTCERLGTFTSHKGRVRSIRWTDDDSSIVSCGMDGQVLQWLVMGSTHRDFVLQQSFKSAKCQFTSAIASKDGDGIDPSSAHIYAVGTDRHLRFITENEAQAVQPHNITLTQLDMWRAYEKGRGQTLFAGTDAGVVRCFPLPLTEHCFDVQCHSAPVTRVAVTPNGAYLLTAGEDGCLSVFTIDAAKEQDKDGVTGANTSGRRRGENALPWAEEVLVSKADLDEKKKKLVELQKKVERTKIDAQTEKQHKAMLFEERKRELEHRYSTELDLAAKRIRELEQERKQVEASFAYKLEQLTQHHHEKKTALEHDSLARLRVEKQRCEDMERKIKTEEEEGRAMIERIKELEENEIQSLIKDYQEKIAHEQAVKARLQAELEGLRKDADEEKKLVEEDVDEELNEVTRSYEEKLLAERTITLKLADAGTLFQKHFHNQRESINAALMELKGMKATQQQLMQDIHALVKDIEINNKELRERDSTIADKHNRIAQLRRKNQELEKFKFVLDYKVSELRRQLEPRRRDVELLKSQITQMQKEVAQYQRAGEALDLDVKRLALKHHGLEGALTESKQERREAAARISRFKADLHDVASALNGDKFKELKAGIRLLYSRHVLAYTPDTNRLMFRDSDKMAETVQRRARALGGASTRGSLARTSEDVRSDYQRQREYLEKSLDALDVKFRKDSQVHRSDSVRIMNENVSLIREINDLRRELHLARSQSSIRDAAVSAMSGHKAVKRGGGAGKNTKVALAMTREIETQQEQIRALKSRLLVLDAEMYQTHNGARMTPDGNS